MFLHIYGQNQWHYDAYIVGDEQSLLALRQDIDEALASGMGLGKAFVNDGEGFTFVTLKVETGWEKMAVPYTNEEATAAERRADAVWPETLAGREVTIVEVPNDPISG